MSCSEKSCPLAFLVLTPKQPGGRCILFAFLLHKNPRSSVRGTDIAVDTIARVHAPYVLRLLICLDFRALGRLNFTTSDETDRASTTRSNRPTLLSRSEETRASLSIALLILATPSVSFLSRPSECRVARPLRCLGFIPLTRLHSSKCGV